MVQMKMMNDKTKLVKEAKKKQQSKSLLLVRLSKDKIRQNGIRRNETTPLQLRASIPGGCSLCPQRSAK